MSLVRDLSIDVSTLSPVAATAFAWHIGGATRVTVIAKATFEIIPSAAARLAKPEPLCSEDKYDPSTSALRIASEMSPHLPNAGIVLTGSAYVPAGADRVTVSLGIHRYGWLVHKRVVLPSPRAASAVEPVVRLPLVSAGFGPVSAASPPRRDAQPHIVPHPSGVPQLPSNVDFRYFQAAPVDQQCAYLEGDEWIMLEGVHPTANLLRTQLPSVRAEARLWLPPTAESAASERGLRLVADTVLVDTDRLVLQIVWRGHIEVSRDDVPVGMTAYVGLSRPDAAVDFPRRPPRPKPVLAGTTAVSDAEIARSREAAAAPFRIGGPDATRAAPAAIPGAPFQRPSPTSPPAPVVPVSAAVFETVAIAPSVAVTEALPAKPDAIVGVPDAPSDGSTGRKRPRPVLGQTLEQRDKPPDRPIAPFAIADAGVLRGPTAPIPGAPFLAPPGENASTTSASIEFVAVEHPPSIPSIPSPAGVFETVALPPPVAPPAAFVSEPPPPLVEPPLPPVEPAAAAVPVVEPLPVVASVAAEPPPATATPTLRDTVVARVRSGTPMFDLNLVGADLSDLDLTGARLSQQNLRDVRFSQSKLTGAELAGTDLTNVDLSKADLSGADLTGARMMRSNLTEARLVGASLERADLTGATLTQACLDQARLTETNLSGTQAVGASFRGALLGHADLRTARFSNANFDGANLDHVAAGRADFSGARFVRASLVNAAMRGVRMPAAVLAFANVTGADLRDADLRGANLHGVDRSTGKFGGANLRDIIDVPPPDAADG